MSTSSQASSRERKNAWHWKSSPCRNCSPSSVAVAAPLVKSKTQCGETNATFLAVRRRVPSPAGLG